MTGPTAAIYGIAGPDLSPDERAFLRDADPLGFILFARNVRDPAQTARLVAALRETVGRADAPVLVDQEGGRVARLKPPHWRARPAARTFGRLHRRDPAAALEACRLDGRLLAADVASVGIDVDCIPVLDVPFPGAHDVIGDRAFADDPAVVAACARAQAEGALAGGVLPVIKHIPGHGRATVDSHFELPTVAASRAELDRVDFAPFRALAELPWGMTAHVRYTALDPDRPATTSPVVIGEIVRGDIGFGGLLLTDDLSMRALGGSFADRARASLAAGCDVALHCSGRMAEMTQVAAAVGPLSAKAQRRVEAGVVLRRARADGADAAALAGWERRLGELLTLAVA